MYGGLSSRHPGRRFQLTTSTLTGYFRKDIIAPGARAARNRRRPRRAHMPLRQDLRFRKSRRGAGGGATSRLGGTATSAELPIRRRVSRSLDCRGVVSARTGRSYRQLPPTPRGSTRLRRSGRNSGAPEWPADSGRLTQRVRSHAGRRRNDRDVRCHRAPTRVGAHRALAQTAAAARIGAGELGVGSVAIAVAPWRSGRIGRTGARTAASGASSDQSALATRFCLGHKLARRRVRGLHPFRRNARRHRLDAVAGAWRQQAGTIPAKPHTAIGMGA